MSNDAAKKMGLNRGKDSFLAAPEAYTILEVDISSKALLQLYDGKPTEQAIIRGIVQKRRQKTLAPPDFVESCESGILEAIQFVRLRADKNGKQWLVIDKGNNRCAALRKVNAKRVAHGHAPFELEGKQSQRVGKGDDAGAFAREQHALSNKRVKMLPSQKAEEAAGFAASGMPPHGMIRYIDGVSSEAEVLELLALAECSEATMDAIDAGEAPVKSALKLAKMGEEEQAAWFAKRKAPKGDRAKVPKAKPRAFGLALAQELEAAGPERRELAALALYMAGEAEALVGHPFLLKVVESAAAMAKAKSKVAEGAASSAVPSEDEAA